MTVYIGSDHGGYQLKEHLKHWLRKQGHKVEDCGNTKLDKSDDYPDFASAVAKKIQENPNDRGIVICRSGVGVSITANKHKGIRSCLGFDSVQVSKAREDGDINVLALPSDYSSQKQAQELVKVFLNTPTSAEPRHVRRREKIKALEMEEKHRRLAS